MELKPASPPAPPRSSPSEEHLTGSVERITFHNADTGFCVLRVKVRGHRDLVTITGHAAAIAAGEFVEASGVWLNDRNHGLQFKAERIKATVPTTLEGLEKYLGSGMIKGIVLAVTPVPATVIGQAQAGDDQRRLAAQLQPSIRISNRPAGNAEQAARLPQISPHGGI